MKRNKTAAGVWLTGAALVLALFCPLPVLAAAPGDGGHPVTVRTEGADSAAICTVELTPLDNAPRPGTVPVDGKKRRHGVLYRH